MQNWRPQAEQIRGTSSTLRQLRTEHRFFLRRFPAADLQPLAMWTSIARYMLSPAPHATGSWHSGHVVVRLAWGQLWPW
jgi:hypothetical protein